jgi:hypothetical protein
MKTETQEDCGPHGALMDGISDHPWTITCVMYISSPKCKRTESRDPRNYFHQLLNLSPHQHFRALTDKWAKSTKIASATPKGRRLIKLLQANIKKILNPPIALEDQRVWDSELQKQQQRVMNKMPILTVPVVTRITDAPPILQSRSPTAKCALRDTPRLHQRVTRNNTPGAVPAINRTHTGTPSPARRMSPRTKTTAIAAPTTTVAMPNRWQLHLFTQQALNVLTPLELATADTIFTP